MKLIKEDVSHDFEKGKEYEREQYWCENDDVWIRVEIPMKKGDENFA